MTLEEIKFEDLHPLEYIETTGCEYIDTGYKPNQNTRIVMDIRATSVTAHAWAFGGRNSASSNSLGLFCYFNDKTWRVDYSTSGNRKTFSGVNTYDFLHIDHNKNTTTVNGVTVSNTTTTFQSDYNLYLLANNNAGTAAGHLVAKLYSCKIYDNGTLVRDFIPCSGGQISNPGLYDRVNKRMYRLEGNDKYTAKEGPEINLTPYNSLQRRRFDTSSKPLDLTPEKHMYIELLEGGTFGINSAPDYIYYAQEGDAEWTPLAPDYPSKSFPAGSKIYVKGELTPSSSYGIGTFSITTAFNVGGNVMSLLFGDNAEGQTSLAGYNYAFQSLFESATKLRDIYLLLPATTLSRCCYMNMFKGCSGITVAPQLPATTLAVHCYTGMFEDCISLEIVETKMLSASNLASWCYGKMFKGCTNLMYAPELPALNLPEGCYANMFEGCSTLRETPQLRATNLAADCYSEMFSGCTNLYEITDLPATYLYENCYFAMFMYCTNINTAAAMTVEHNPYRALYGMYYGCTALTSAEFVIINDASGQTCCRCMFYGCQNLSSPPVLSGEDLGDACYSSMFENCKKLQFAPGLPATSLATYCYEYMFSGCELLTTAPELLAPTLPENCYSHMFYYCGRLNYIKMMAISLIPNNSLLNWVQGVASTGTFEKDPSLTLERGLNGIPEGWTVIGENTGDEEDITLGWTVQSGTWNEESNSSAIDGVQYTCESPGTSSSTVIRYAWSGLTEITFNCVYNGENNYDYLTVGELDTTCTRDSYKISLKGNSGVAQSFTYYCNTGTHYVEFCYSKDSSQDTDPDNATVYIESTSNSGGSSTQGITWSVQSGTWTEESNSSAYDDVQYVCESPGSDGSTVIRCTISGQSGALFVIRSQGESSYDYLNAGELDSPCTRDSYKTSLKGNQETDVEVSYGFGDYGTHYVEFCYSKDSSVDTPPDNGVVYLKDCPNFGTDL